MIQQQWASFSDEILKTAATRQVKEMRKLYEGTKSSDPRVAAASEAKLKGLAQRLYGAGVQKDSPGGIQADRKLQMLGRGNEGVAVPVLGPHGVEVRKQYDPKSQLWSPSMQKDKAELLRNSNPKHVAQLYGHHSSPDFDIHRMELVKGKDLKQAIKELPDGGRFPSAEGNRLGEQVRGVVPHLDAAAHKAGLSGHRDAAWHEGGQFKYNPGNIKIQPDGTAKVIDVLPTRQVPANYHTAPGRLEPMDAHKAHFPGGIPAQHGETPLLDLTKKLGPGSRQAPKGIPMSASKLPPGTPLPATGVPIRGPAPPRPGTPQIKSFMGRWGPGLRKAAPWAAGAAGVAGAGLLAHHFLKRNVPEERGAGGPAPV
jgi:hypothetical protein